MICFVGLPGSGKSTIGRQVARRLQVAFADSDQVIEARLGCSIRDYFEREGEESFRQVEETAIDSLTLNPVDVGVLSTGGGSVLRSVNRQRLKERCQVIYLRSSPDELFHRLRNDRTRPLLQVPDPLSRLRELHAERDPLYLETAHIVIGTGPTSVSALVNTVWAQLGPGLNS